jgi:hypothetical protein
MEQSFIDETLIFSSEGFGSQSLLIWRLGSPLCDPKVRRSRYYSDAKERVRITQDANLVDKIILDPKSSMSKDL